MKIIAIVFPVNGRKVRSPPFSLAFTSTARFNTSRTFFVVVPGTPACQCKGAEHCRRSERNERRSSGGDESSPVAPLPLATRGYPGGGCRRRWLG